MTFKEEFCQIFCSLGLSRFAEGDMPDKFEILCDSLVATNKIMNLTALTERRDIILKHFADSLYGVHLIPENASIIDIGCGGGFPTLPIAIVRPDVKIVALDSTAKKLTFVADMAKKLSLNVETLAMRAEEASRDMKYRENFDIAISRAVARLNILDELCMPFVRPGGSFIALKGADAESEREEAERGIKLLGGEISLFESTVTEGIGSRAVILVKKINKTPEKYPRVFAKIKKMPL